MAEFSELRARLAATRDGLGGASVDASLAQSRLADVAARQAALERAFVNDAAHRAERARLAAEQQRAEAEVQRARDARASMLASEASLRNDLGAESIDLLDIVFRLERNFGIKIPRGELFPENVSDPDLTEDGKLTPKGLDELKQKMPYADLTEFSANPEVEKILDLYTVDTLVKYVAGKLSA